MALTATSTERTEASSTAVDVVSIMSAASGEQVFALARPMTASVYEVAKVMEHPLEDGSSVIDHIVYMPVEIEMPLMVTGGDAATVYGEIRALFRSGELLTVQTRARTFDSMIIAAMPHDERPEEFDALAITLQLREAIFVASVYGGAVGAARVTPPPTRAGRRQRPTQARGQQQAPAAPAADENRGSILFRAFGG